MDSAPSLSAELISVTPGYFRALGARLLAGREFTDADELGKPNVAVVDRTTAERCWPGQDAIGKRRFAGFGVLLFAASATLLASVGLYGVIAYGVSQRSREIGIRMAMGARPLDVVRLLLGESAQVVGIGVGAGLALAVVFTHLLSRLLYGVASTDGLVFASAAGVLVVVAFAAATVPARRAGRIDPIVVLRGE